MRARVAVFRGVEAVAAAAAIQRPLGRMSPADMDRMKILAGYTATEDAMGDVLLFRGTPLNGVKVQMWSDEHPTLADLAQAAFADHLAVNA